MQLFIHIIKSKTLQDLHNIFDEFPDNGEIESVDGLDIADDKLDQLIFKVGLFRKKNPLAKHIKKCDLLYSKLIHKKAVLRKCEKNIRKIESEVDAEINNYTECVKKLKFFLQLLNQGKGILEEKIADLKKNEKANYKKIKLLSDVISSNSDNKNFITDINYNAIISNVSNTITSCEPIGYHQIDDVVATFNYLNQIRVIEPLKKYDEERSFISRFKEWASDSLKNFFGYGRVSTKETLKLIVPFTSGIFESVKKSVKRIDNYMHKPKFGNTIKLYSNAYDSVERKTGSFVDIISDMENATDNIFIVGWAISASQKFGSNHLTLPELLVKKALGGVKVVILAWNNIMPGCSEQVTNFMPILHNYIKKLKLNNAEKKLLESNLHIKFSPREIGYSDHQKIVVTDDTAYLGGLDLMEGNSDINKWHDAHVRLNGPVVKDIVSIIHGRWDTKKSVSYGSNTEANQLLLAKKIYLSQLQHDQKNDTITEHSPVMQIACSLRKHLFKSNEWHSTARKDTRVHEIQNAYITSIKNAEKFIYMENQFFIGPRFHSDGKSTVLGDNKVIIEIARKIISKIKNNEPFHFYCQLPYRPEGEPDSASVKIILRKQWKTIEWFIKTIDKYATEKEKSAADYLTFYNLGMNVDNQYQMKYTHAKCMITDDKELIIGSANCNERSMCARDSEVALYLTNEPEQIKQYRHQLMREHFSTGNFDISDLLTNPNDKNTIDKLHTHLDSNLNSLTHSKQPIATPWGNQQPMKQLISANPKKPPHVLDRSPFYFRLVAPLSTRINRLVR